MSRPRLRVEESSSTWSFRPPHCDQRVLHAPGECEVCDLCPELQAERDALDVCFSGKTDRRWPCPADEARGAAHQRWHGNRPWRRAP